jgi:hypothetical protein
MSNFIIPAPDAPAEEWGLLAVSIPGWRWMLTMADPSGLWAVEWVDDQHKRVRCWDIHGSCIGEYTAYRMIPDPDDPATEGCLLRLLGSPRAARQELRRAGRFDTTHHLQVALMLGNGTGRACIAAAAGIGRWPGGE